MASQGFALSCFLKVIKTIVPNRLVQGEKKKKKKKRLILFESYCVTGVSVARER